MSVLDELVEARAALDRMRDDVHGGREECGSDCTDYHDAVRAVTFAAEACGMDVQELAYSARYLNRIEYGYEEERP